MNFGQQPSGKGKVLMERYQITEVIGDGTFGSVSRAIDLTNGRTVAIKRMKKKVHRWEESINQAEIISLIDLAHPNIVKLHEVMKHNDELYFIFENLDRNVFQLMKDRQKQTNEPFTETQIRNIIYQTLQGLAYMHRHGYFHRDIKPENLLELHGTVKIADFGLAKPIKSKPPYTDYVSTRWYRAPEVILRAPIYGPPIDIFAVGAIMVELYNFWPLFPGTTEADQIHKIMAVMGTPSELEWPEGYELARQMGFKFPKQNAVPLKSVVKNASEEAIDLIYGMLRYSPKMRLTALQALQHPFFQCKIPIMTPLKLDDLESVQETTSVNTGNSGEKQSEGENREMRRTITKKEDDYTSGRTNINLRNARYKPGVNPFQAASK
eukprot:TRINITY_DN7470_c0_g3_i1.p1 TRINITY_DN7470_c0_g3~~TRINITY_DN7470_c0_g3_i1.p1  ORF type:complete len:380 (+),score=50.95 TRINITY_DN7470_c0_g3_i1:58-1197(+)